MAFQIFLDQENLPAAHAAHPKLAQKQTNTLKLSEVTNFVQRNQPDRQAKKKGLQPQQQPLQATKPSGLSFSGNTNSLSSDVWKPNNDGWNKIPTQSFSIFDENSVAGRPSKPLGQEKNKRQPFADVKNNGNTGSGYQGAFLYQPIKDETIKFDEDVHVCSPMVLDSSMMEVPSATLSKRLHVIETMLPESYISKIYDYLKLLETNCRPKPHYMRKQQDITPQMRSILIDWLVEVAEEYKLHNETLFLAVSFIDRFLSKMSVLRGKLQLVGTAAMFIASKYEEIYPPDVGEFVYLTDDTYTKKQVLRMEQLILTVLSFRLGVPTASYFLQHFFRLSNTDTPTQHLASFLSELSLMEVEPYVKYLPSEIAAASLALARLASGQDLWPHHISQITKYRLEDLMPCIRNLHSSWQQAPQQPQQAIVSKYKTEKWSNVSTMSPPPLTALELAEL